METICSQCGKEFPESELVSIKGSKVCAECKPLLLRKIQEGDTKSFVNFVYKGFWIRYWAKVLDGIILILIEIFLFVLFRILIAWGFRGFNLHSLLGEGLFNFINISVNLGYYVYFNGTYGATPGKMIIGARIVNTDGTPISYGKAFARFFAEWLSAIIFGLGYIMAAFDSQKRALHDRICGTLVVAK